jgi:Zn finger protein HypA/HybF involved in hydrogenase expression
MKCLCITPSHTKECGCLCHIKPKRGKFNNYVYECPGQSQSVKFYTRRQGQWPCPECGAPMVQIEDM